MKTMVIVIPTYNEEGNIEKVIQKVEEVVEKVQNWSTQILVVDSHSQDKTAEIVKEIQKKNKVVHLLETEKEGLGKAYMHGFKYAIENLKAYVIFEMDADLSHDPTEIPHFLKAIEQGADFVIGSRYMKGGSIPQDWGIHRKILSGVGNLIIRLGFMKPQITDWTGGYRAVKSWIVKESFSHIEKYTGYVFQIAFLDYALKKHAVIKEVPIQFKDRVVGSSKISFGSYILNIFAYIFQNSSFIKFVIVGATGFVVDIGLFYFLTKHAHFVSWHANLLTTEAAVITNFLLNNFWSFSHKRIEHKASAYIKNFLKYNAVSSGSIAIQTLGVEICKHFFGPSNLVWYKVAIIAIVIIPYSYFFFNRFIWKEKKS